MVAVVPLAFEEHLVRALWRDQEPWFVGKDVCVCLGLKNSTDALSSLDGDEKGVATTDPLGPGGEQSVVIISEPGVYRLVFRSRKPEAERFKRWLAHDVLPQLRRTGKYAPTAAEYARDPASDAAPQPHLPRDMAAEPLLHRLQLVRECRSIHGRAVAAILWTRLGLPPVPPPPPGPAGEARQLLRHLLDAPVFEGRERIRDLVELALDDDEPARLRLMASGVRVDAERETFIIANSHFHLQHVLAATEWRGQPYHRVLRRLPLAAPSPPVSMGPHKMRGTTLPAGAMDD